MIGNIINGWVDSTKARRMVLRVKTLGATISDIVLWSNDMIAPRRGTEFHAWHANSIVGDKQPQDVADIVYRVDSDSDGHTQATGPEDYVSAYIKNI